MRWYIYGKEYKRIIWDENDIDIECNENYDDINCYNDFCADKEKLDNKKVNKKKGYKKCFIIITDCFNFIKDCVPSTYYFVLIYIILTIIMSSSSHLYKIYHNNINNGIDFFD